MDNIHLVYPSIQGDIRKEDATASTGAGVLGAIQSLRGWADWVLGTNSSTKMEVEAISCVASEDGMHAQFLRYSGVDNRYY
jgi:hypothetical protein